MTLEEFEEDVTMWQELIDFCNENSSDICDDIIPEERLKEEVETQLTSCLPFMDWTEIRDALTDIDEYCEFYVHNSLLDFEEADSFLFEERKQSVQTWAEEQDIFDEEVSTRPIFSSTFKYVDDEDEDDDDMELMDFTFRHLL